RTRGRVRDDVAPILAQHDALLSPTAPAAAPAGLAWTGDASLCQPWSTLGAPSISLPSGISAAGLPLALQLVQAPGADTRLLGAGGRRGGARFPGGGAGGGGVGGAMWGPRDGRGGRPRSATTHSGRAERWGVWGAMSGPPTYV